MTDHSRSRRSRAAHSVSEVVLTVAAIGGVLCIVLVGLAFTMNMTLIMFKTGSMSPTIPAGSVALVQEIPASSMNVGDVVTVDRVGMLPITHRVTSIDPAADGGSRTFTMRGDANPVDDADSYTASSVRIVRGHVPGLANIIVWFSHPAVLGGITLAAAGLVTWAFWPRRGGTGDINDAGERSDGADLPDTDPSNKTRHAVGAKSTALTMAILAAVSAVTFTAAEPAFAAETETHIDSTVLKLTSIADTDLMSQMNPGLPVVWQVGVRADAPSPGVVTISLSATGNAANTQKLTVAIDSCAVRWTAAACASGAQSLVPTQLLTTALLPQELDGTRILTTMPSAEQRWLLITVTLAGTVEPGFSETLHIHASGFGDDVSTGGDTGTLAYTGALDLSGVFLLALSTVLAGIAVAWFAAFRRRRRS